MHQIAPLETFPIVYVLADPNDTGTYFVQSVVRNSATGAILKISNQNFVNLTDSGNRRFTKNIQAPADPSGLGFYIDITTTVYTDSGYTTLSPNYVQQVDKYLVQTRWNTGLGVGGGGFSSNKDVIDYTLIKKLILEAFSELPTTEIEQVDTMPILDGIEALMTKIEAIKIPQAQDMTPYIKEVGSLIQKSIKNISLDLSPVMEKIDGITIPEIPESIDHTPALEEIKKSIIALQKILPQQKYSDFLDEMVSTKLQNTHNTLKTTRMNKFLMLDNSERIKNLLK